MKFSTFQLHKYCVREAFFAFAFCLSKECPPATEDMLDEQTTVLTNLGSGEEAALLRAKMQSRSLLSDMESFKVKFEY